MYSSVISNVVRRAGPFDNMNLHKQISEMKNGSSVESQGGGGPGGNYHQRHRSTTVASNTNDGKVTVGLSTSSSMRSHMMDGMGGGKMPHLIPQKTNVLTGAVTKYFSDQTNNWRQDYSDLVAF